jgi:hypothetical protein
MGQIFSFSFLLPASYKIYHRLFQGRGPVLLHGERFPTYPQPQSTGADLPTRRTNTRNQVSSPGEF